MLVLGGSPGKPLGWGSGSSSAATSASSCRKSLLTREARPRRGEPVVETDARLKLDPAPRLELDPAPCAYPKIVRRFGGSGASPSDSGGRRRCGCNTAAEPAATRAVGMPRRATDAAPSFTAPSCGCEATARRFCRATGGLRRLPSTDARAGDRGRSGSVCAADGEPSGRREANERWRTNAAGVDGSSSR
jgi:hypothetical protein